MLICFNYIKLIVKLRDSHIIFMIEFQFNMLSTPGYSGM